MLYFLVDNHFFIVLISLVISLFKDELADFKSRISLDILDSKGLLMVKKTLTFLVTSYHPKIVIILKPILRIRTSTRLLHL